MRVYYLGIFLRITYHVYTCVCKERELSQHFSASSFLLNSFLLTLLYFLSYYTISFICLSLTIQSFFTYDLLVLWPQYYYSKAGSKFSSLFLGRMETFFLLVFNWWLMCNVSLCLSSLATVQNGHTWRALCNWIEVHLENKVCLSSQLAACSALG